MVSRDIGLIAIVVLGFLLCTPAQAQAERQTYTSPLGNFSVKDPGGVGLRIQQENDDDGGIIAFHDDFGNYRSIFYLRLSPRSLELQNNPEAHRDNLEKFFREYAMTWLFQPASPTASVTYQEHSEFGEESAFFAIVDLPGASTMFNLKTQRPYDTKRGMLVFTRGQFIYMLGSGENPSVLELGEAAESLEELRSNERANLLSFAATIDFR